MGELDKINSNYNYSHKHIKKAIEEAGQSGGDITELTEKVEALETAVGDSESGLVKDVADLGSSVSGLETTVGDNESGLVKDVADLGTTVGDSESGLVKDVADLGSSVSGLETTVGDSESGLVKDVADLGSSVSGLETTVGDSESGLVKDVADLGSSVSDLETTVGDSNSGLVKDVNDLKNKTTVYTKNYYLDFVVGNYGGTPFGRIYLNIIIRNQQNQYRAIYNFDTLHQALSQASCITANGQYKDNNGVYNVVSVEVNGVFVRLVITNGNDDTNNVDISSTTGVNLHSQSIICSEQI